MDVFQIQASLEELASHKKPTSKEDMKRHLEKVVQIGTLGTSGPVQLLDRQRRASFLMFALAGQRM